MTTNAPDIDHGKPKCGGKRRSAESGGKPCTRPAGWGTDHVGVGRCKLHGGSTPSHQQAGQKALAAAAVVTFGLPREVDPRDALLEEVYRAAGVVDFLRDQVQLLTAEQVVWGKTEEVEKQAGEFPGVDVTHKAAVNVWVDLYAQERRHLVNVCKVAIQAGIEERKVRLAEQQGAMLAGVIRNILSDLNLSPEQSARVPEVVPRHLRAIA